MEKFFTTQSDLICHNGKNVASKLPMDESKYDKEDIGEMFDIVLKDGTKLEAFPDELISDEIYDLFVEETCDEDGEVDNNYFRIWYAEHFNYL